MSPHKEKLALFIDGANLYATAKSLGFDIDYKRLLREFQSRGDLLRAFYYTAVIEDQEFSSIRPLIDWLDYNGYTVVTKPTKEFVDQTCPCRKLKHERIDGEARLRSVPKSGDRLPALAVARASPCAMISAYELHCSIVDKKRAGTEDAARRKQRRGPDSPVGLNQ